MAHMKRPVLFGFLGFFAGFVVAIIGFMLTELFSYLVYPFPADFDYKSQEAMYAHIAKYPQWVLGVCVALWGFTLMAASWVGTRIGGRIAGIALCAILAFLFYKNILEHPYPTWFKAAELVSIPLSLFIGYQMAMAGQRAVEIKTAA
jgi:uncharacterized membrane protein